MKKDFNRKFLRTLGVVAALAMPLGAFGAVGNGCDENSENEYINPELALCSTHVYNIGGVENIEDESQREIMRDVIALKTTIMTQQMYKQYEYLEATIKRFKTQLEKAVLTTKLQAAGADATGASSSSGNGSSFKSNDRNIFIAGVENCNNKITNQKVYECLQSNFNSIYNASNNGQNMSVELRKQLANDYKVAVESNQQGECKETCCDYKTITKRDAFQKCLDRLQTTIRKGYEDSVNKQNNQSFMMFQGKS